MRVRHRAPQHKSNSSTLHISDEVETESTTAYKQQQHTPHQRWGWDREHHSIQATAAHSTSAMRVRLRAPQHISNSTQSTPAHATAAHIKLTPLPPYSTYAVGKCCMAQLNILEAGGPSECIKSSLWVRSRDVWMYSIRYEWEVWASECIQSTISEKQGRLIVLNPLWVRSRDVWLYSIRYEWEVGMYVCIQSTMSKK